MKAVPQMKAVSNSIRSARRRVMAVSGSLGAASDYQFA